MKAKDYVKENIRAHNKVAARYDYKQKHSHAKGVKRALNRK